MAGLLYAFEAEGSALEPYAFAGAGIMREEETNLGGGSGLAIHGGVGLGLDLGVDAFLEGRMTAGGLDRDGGVNARTAYFAVLVGLEFDLTGPE